MQLHHLTRTQLCVQTGAEYVWVFKWKGIFSNHIHGWLKNSPFSKRKKYPTALLDTHQCPQCKLALETQENVLHCGTQSSSVHKR